MQTLAILTEEQQLCSERDYQFYTWWFLVGRCDVQFTYRVCLHGLILMTGVPSSRILGDPGADSGGEGKSKRAEKYGTKKSKERREEPLGTIGPFIRGKIRRVLHRRRLK